MFWQTLDLLSLTKENGTFYQNLTTESKGHWDSASEHQLKPNNQEHRYSTWTEKTGPRQEERWKVFLGLKSLRNRSSILSAAITPSNPNSRIYIHNHRKAKVNSITCYIPREAWKYLWQIAVILPAFQTNKRKLHFCKNWEIPYFHSYFEYGFHCLK